MNVSGCYDYLIMSNAFRTSCAPSVTNLVAVLVWRRHDHALNLVITVRNRDL